MAAALQHSLSYHYTPRQRTSVPATFQVHI